MLRTFNCGIGMIVVAAADRADEVMARLRAGRRERRCASARRSAQRAASASHTGRSQPVTEPRRRVAILISGRGSNMVVADRGGARAGLSGRDRARPLEPARCRRASRARARPASRRSCVDHKALPDRESFERRSTRPCASASIDLICLAGFMRVLTPWFVERWDGRMINIHPPSCRCSAGPHTHERALADGVLVHGCTVHFVVPELDAGPIVAQAAMPVVPGDTPDSLAARVLAQEHMLYPQALRSICAGEVRLDGGRVVFARGWDSASALRSPS